MLTINVAGHHSCASTQTVYVHMCPIPALHTAVDSMHYLHSELILFSIADGDESQEALEHSLVVDYERKLAAKRREVARLQQQRDKLMQTQRRLMELQGLIGDVCLMKLWSYDIDSSFLPSDSVFGSADSQVQVSSCFSPPSVTRIDLLICVRSYCIVEKCCGTLI